MTGTAEDLFVSYHYQLRGLVCCPCLMIPCALSAVCCLGRHKTHLGRLSDVIMSLGQCEVADAPRNGGGAGLQAKVLISPDRDIR